MKQACYLKYIEPDFLPFSKPLYVYHVCSATIAILFYDLPRQWSDPVAVGDYDKKIAITFLQWFFMDTKWIQSVIKCFLPTILTDLYRCCLMTCYNNSFYSFYFPIF